MAAAAQIVLAGIVGAVGQPEADDMRANRLRNLDALQHVIDGSLPYRFIEVAQAAQSIHVFLKEIGVDGPQAQAQFGGVSFHRLPVLYFVPGDVNGDAGADARHFVDLGGIDQLLPQRARRAGPVKDFEARPRIAIAPRWRLDAELLHGRDYAVDSDSSLLQAVFDF